MKFTEISEILEGREGKVSIRGWLHHKRSSGGIQFLLVRDGSGVVQCILSRDSIEEEKFDEIERLPVESVIKIRGKARKDERAPGGYEIGIEEIEVLSEAEQDYPISKKYHGVDFLMDHRHLYLRSEKLQLVMRVRAEVLKLAREWFEKHGYTEVQMPIFTAAACEGGATLFPVKYFDSEVYLTQSWQLYAEAAIASLGKIYTIAPSFRAEKSRTRRHLTEYWHLEAEKPFCDLKKLMKIEEKFVAYICKKLAKRMERELKELDRDPEDLLKIKPPFKRITYTEAVDILKKDGVRKKWGEDLTWKDEKALLKRFDKPFFVTHYPKSAKAFYHKPDPKDPKVTLSVDLLAKDVGEITGGGQRIHKKEELIKRIKEEGLDIKDYQWYIDLRRWGSVPHAGFGLGLERVVKWICKLKHIRDAIPFPRMIRKVYP